MINYFGMSGIIVLLVASMLFGYGLLWTIAWFNNLAKFIMQISKDEVAKLETHYCIMPPMILASAFFLWRIAEYLLTKA